MRMWRCFILNLAFFHSALVRQHSSQYWHALLQFPVLLFRCHLQDVFSLTCSTNEDLPFAADCITALVR